MDCARCMRDRRYCALYSVYKKTLTEDEIDSLECPGYVIP